MVLLYKISALLLVGFEPSKNYPVLCLSLLLFLIVQLDARAELKKKIFTKRLGLFNLAFIVYLGCNFMFILVDESTYCLQTHIW